MSLDDFSEGVKIKIFHQDTMVDLATVCSVTEDNGRNIVGVDGAAGRIKFVLTNKKKNEYKMLFPDPSTGKLCCKKEGRVYVFNAV